MYIRGVAEPLTEAAGAEYAMRRRAGRRRKVGRRKPSGDLVSAPRPKPAQIAARMPHRRALEEKAVDQFG